MSLEDRFDRHLASLELAGGPALVAVSGGADSLALLALLARSPAANGLRLHVAHADHGLHPESGAVADVVRMVAADYELPFLLGELHLPQGSSETVARTARYAWLDSAARRADAVAIFTAHHQDDQVETILMRALKGSGAAGLAGIPTIRGLLVRPLLPFRREELALHLRGLGRHWWEDPANQDPRHLRSWLRQEVLPLLRRRIPDLDRRLLVLGRQAASDRGAWNRVLEQVPGIEFRREAEGVSVAATPLRGYDSAVLRALLGALGRRAGCPVGPARAARIERLLAKGRSGAVAELGAGYTAELSFGRLGLFRGVAHRPLWQSGGLGGVPGRFEAPGFRLSWNTEPAPERQARVGFHAWFTGSEFSVRPWLAGDRIRPLGGTGRRLVVRCMQDARIPRRRREGWPVVLAGSDIVWVPGVCRSAEQLPAPGAGALRIDAQFD